MKLKHILFTAAAILSLPLCAQNTYSGYFLDNYLYRYQMNPAMGNENNFVSFPALGNINLGIHGNLHLTEVFYKVNGRTALFTNPAVSASEALSGIHDKNLIGSAIKLDIMNAGFKAFGGYNTVGLNLRINLDAKIPGSLFELAKEGVTNRTYDIKHLGVHANAYAELAFGHSRNIMPNLRVGAALKFLIGGGNVDAYLHRADLNLGTDGWIGTTDADIYTNIKGLEFKEKYNEDAGRTYVNGVDVNSPGPNGFGLGLDLGASYTLNDDWEFSAAVLDFGFISWSNTRLASTDGVQQVNTDSFTFNADDSADNSFSNEWERLRDDLTGLYQLRNMGNPGSRTRMLAATLNFAAAYTFPLYRNLKFGLVNTTRINGSYTTTDFRLSANVRPVKCFSADASFAVGTYGCSFGWLVNLNLKGFSMFVGMDRTFGKLCKQFVPLSSNGSFNFGIDFPF